MLRPTTLVLLGLVCCTWVRGEPVRKFPDGFRFGAATAAYQVEGAWDVADKGESIWDRLCHTTDGVVDGGSGDVADDSYHLYRRDVQMARELGLDFYRFSISWPRLLPSGFADGVSEDGKRYYSDLIDELLTHGIQPVVTLYHWDLPQRLQDLGGWASPLVVEWFADYARVVYGLYADRVKTWITINEPLVVCEYAYGSSWLAPRLNMSGIADYLCNRHLLLAHAKAWRIFDEEFRPKYGGKCAITNHLMWTEPKSEDEEDQQAAEDLFQSMVGRYSHAIYTAEGGWPPSLEARVAERSAAQGFPRSRLPPFSLDEINYIRGTFDFYGFNQYTSLLVGRARGGFPQPSVADDVGAALSVDPAWPSTQSAWFKVDPPGIRKLLRRVKERYGNPEIIITENGYSSAPGLWDRARVQYYRDYLDQILDSVYLDGCNVTHYTAWSLMDNFEWADGYTSRFGLYEVDFEDPARKRRPRMSALVYRELLRTRTLDREFEPATLDMSAEPAHEL